MKPNIFLIIVSVLISGLAGFGFYAANSGETYCLLLTIGSSLCFTVTLICCLGIKIEGNRVNINFKILSAIFFIIFLIINLIFNFSGIKVAPYIIINGISLLIFSIIEYGILKSNK